jgi:ERCC4-related helicase
MIITSNYMSFTNECCQVHHVVLFDYPRDPSEFLRRVGRTGRVNRSGLVSILAYGNQVRNSNNIYYNEYSFSSVMMYCSFHWLRNLLTHWIRVSESSLKFRHPLYPNH